MLLNCWLGQYDFTKTPPTYHVKVPSHYVIATYGSLMLESPDYFFRVREIGGLRQTTAKTGRSTAYWKTSTHVKIGKADDQLSSESCGSVHSALDSQSLHVPEFDS